MNTEEVVRQTRQTFFAYRNGVVADSLKKAGDPHTFVMGCQLADIISLAASLQQSPELAEAFWADRNHRECRLIAPMLYPVGQLDSSTALRWAKDCRTTEEADVLCHRLLRKSQDAKAIVNSLTDSKALLERYVSFRLMLNIVDSQDAATKSAWKSTVDKQIPEAQGALKTLLCQLQEAFQE